VSTEKRQRQKAGRQARLEAEQKAKKRRQTLRRTVTFVIIAALVVGIVLLVSHHSTKKKTTAAAATTTTTKASTSSTTAPTSSTTTAPAAGGSGNTSPSAITTSADCPASLSTTLNKPYWTSPPPMTIDPTKTYTATVTTDVGPFTIQLDPQAAPKAVNNFVFLANQHFYDCIVFHRVIQTFMDQTGDPTGTGDGGPGYKFADELPKTANPQYPLGSVAMANSGPNTNGSQFFIVAGQEGETLSPNYTLFGTVTSGMSVVQKINADGAAASSSQGTPTVEHRMISVTIAES
jgi:cyclophilin family peptidyl-prolyl cis-trans isomerase